MSSNIYRLDDFDIRFTDAYVNLRPGIFFRLLPPAGVIVAVLQLVTGMALLAIAAGMIAGAGVDTASVAPLLVVALIAVNVALALDSGRGWGLVLASLQLLALGSAGYMLSVAGVSLAGVLVAHGTFVMLQLVDLPAFRHAPLRVWLGAELGLLLLTAVWSQR